MDVAYDAIQEEALSPQEPAHPSPFSNDAPPAEADKTSTTSQRPLSSDLNTEFREAYQTIASTAWGAKLGGLWGTVRKQGESYYNNAAKELSTASREASKASNSSSADFINHTSTTPPRPRTPDAPFFSTDPASTSTPTANQTINTASDPSKTPTQTTSPPPSLPADIANEASALFSSFRLTATSRLKQLQKAEDAADEALLQFGSNVRDFFRDAVTITPPSDSTGSQKKGDVLFESTVGTGSSSRKLHLTRTDAHLHVLHTNPAPFTSEQSTTSNPAYPAWLSSTSFSVDKKTDDIAQDLSRYPVLRTMMEKLVPDQIAYAEFWSRYYFLRHVIEEEEKKRKELLSKTLEEEEVGWDDDEDDEDAKKEDTAGTPKQSSERKQSSDLLKPAEPRRSNEGQSVADSESSYDIVSQGQASRGPDSPTTELERKKVESKKDEGDEEDWE